MRTVFECRQCGQCCQGQGGIYLTHQQAQAVARFLGLTREQLRRRYLTPAWGQLAIETDEDGFCLFHDRDRRVCTIHPVKPDTCRDWPFFHGMLTERQAFVDARDACPGIAPDATWEEFLDWHARFVDGFPCRSYISLSK
jgi:hypothetical protein